MQRFKKIVKHNKKKLIAALIICLAYYFCLPKVLFTAPTSTVITSKNNLLLGAKIADDGQWRFPETKVIPEKFKACILAFEDEYFYKHPGFNPISIIKAFKENYNSGQIKRGGSTITQQVIRLSRQGKQRTYWEKFKEIILATRLELRYNKEDILALYSSHAPFGGNVVGIDAASWRYFNRNAKDLSWSESATLAVLPNAPSLIYPGKNQQSLLAKRNRLLKKLLDQKTIDSLTYQLSIAENLPIKPYPLPQIAPHLLQHISKKHKGQLIKTSINKHLQEQTNNIVFNHYNLLKQNEIYNIAVLVLDVKTRKVLTYVGNSPTDNKHQNFVNIIDKPRSTGSILKPFLYTAMLDAGDILPSTLIPDVPTQFGDYEPQNFNKEFDGAVSAKQALSRSLNVPAVRMLNQFGLDRFHHYLKKLNLRDIKYNANHYGLSLVLGGAESNLWDLCKNYAAMSSTLNHFTQTSSEYFKNEFCEPTFFEDEIIDFGARSSEKTLFDAASIYHTYQSLKEVNRPEGEDNWEFFDSSKEIAWKTGTSYGFRDAWAIGTTKDYVVGVWVGNADGEGRPGLVGVQTAAPILFNVFDLLPKSNWFNQPFDEMAQINTCNVSGYRASLNCKNTSKTYVQKSGLKTSACPYHKLIHLDKNKLYRVNSTCETSQNITTTSWFILPPLMAHYYKKKHPFYKPLPPFKPGCFEQKKQHMEFIYPNDNNKIFLPKDFNQIKNEVILKVTHSIPETTLYWYLNNKYIGKTKNLHHIAIKPKQGNYTITVTDEFGNEIKKNVDFSQ